MRYSFFLLVVLSLGFLSGCGNKLPFGGKVTFSDDGSPLTVGSVVFTTDTYSARGALKEDGSYRISSESNNDGLPPGKYKVYITGAQKRAAVRADGFVPLIAKKYTTVKDTDLEVEVKSGVKTFDFTVERSDAAK